MEIKDIVKNPWVWVILAILYVWGIPSSTMDSFLATFVLFLLIAYLSTQDFKIAVYGAILISLTYFVKQNLWKQYPLDG